MEHSEVDSVASTSGSSTFTSTGSGSDERLIEIFEKEIDREIEERMGNISEISDNIRKCQQALDRLRKEAVIHFYMYSHQDVEKQEQQCIHPAVKKLIGKRPWTVSQTEQFMATNLTDWKNETRKKLLKKNFIKHKNKHPNKIRRRESVDNESIIKPRYVPPNIPGNPQENSSLRGNTKKMHMRVLIGNVAKQIQQDGGIFDPATHKWMVYVRSAPGSLAVDCEVARVHFFLHPSYKPHDIVSVPSPPFILNRRGWGEFPMRVQLHFKNRMNKPTDIIHHLKLNGSRSGYHTRSAETFADLWLYPFENAQENKADSGTSSKDILLLASDMLKEEVPDFTSEVICNRCQTTSLGTDSHNCTCDIKVSTQESGEADTNEESSASSSEESDSSDSDDSATETMTPKPLPCWKMPYNIDIPQDCQESQILLKEEIKAEEFSEEMFSDDSNVVRKISNSKSCMIDAHKKQDEELQNKNLLERGRDIVSTTIKREIDGSSSGPGCFSLESNINQFEFANVKSDILDIEASDIMDALEMKQEVKEPNENVEGFHGNKVTEKSKESNVLPRDVEGSRVLLDVNYLPINEEQSMEVDCEQLGSKVTEKSKESNVLPRDVEGSRVLLDVNYLPINEEQSMEVDCEQLGSKVTEKSKESNVLPRDVEGSRVLLDVNYLPINEEQSMEVDCEQLGSKVHFSNNIAVNSNQVTPANMTSFTASHPENSTLENNLIIEEVPIDDFINNIVVEEIVVEIPEITAEEEKANKTEIITEILDIPEVTLPLKQSVLEIENSPSRLHKSLVCSKEIVQSKPISPITIHPMETVTPGQKLIIQKTIPLKSSEKFLKNNQVSSAKQPLMKATPTFTNIQAVQLQKSVTDKKELQANNQSPLTAKGPLKTTLPYTDVVKSPKYIKITKELLANKQGSSNTTHVLNKLKIGELCQASNLKKKNLMVSQGALVLKSSKIVHIQSYPKVEKINSNNINPVTKIAVGLHNISKENTQNTSLLRPEFRSNNISKLNTRNPNSLLKHPLNKPNITQSNSSKNQLSQKSAIQLLASSRPITYSVLKSTINCASSQQKIKLQNSMLNSIRGNSCSLTGKTQNLAINQPVPQVHKTIISQNINQVMTVPSCNQEASTLQTVYEHNLSQESLELRNHVYRKDMETLLVRKTDSPQVLNNVQDYSSEKCCAPKSFSRHSYLPDPKLLLSGHRRHNVNHQILKGQIEDIVNLNDTGNVNVGIMSFNELMKVIHFPRTSIPSRPVVSNSGGREIEVKTLELGTVLSCNSLHNDLQRTYVIQPEAQFGRKTLMVNKDQVNSAVNEQVLYYLEQLRLLVNTCMFAEMEAAVRWLIRGLPVVHQDARLVAYRRVHPYCAVSTEAYCSWPSFKQTAAEWLRAKTVVRLLTALNAKGVLSESVWSTRKVYWWSRTHGYSPSFCLIGPENPTNSSTDCIQKLQQKTSPTKVLEWMVSVRHKVKNTPEEEVDVVGVDSQENEDKNNHGGGGGGEGGLICGMPWVQDMHCYVVNQVAKMGTGVQLGQEPLVAGGPAQSVAATLLTHASMALAEDLVRRALDIAACRGSGSLEPRDVCRVILKRPEFDIFTGQGLEADMTFRDYLRCLPSPKPH